MKSIFKFILLLVVVNLSSQSYCQWNIPNQPQQKNYIDDIITPPNVNVPSNFGFPNYDQQNRQIIEVEERQLRQQQMIMREIESQNRKPK